MARFYFVRHGETEYNLRGLRCGGDQDIALTAHGEAQAMGIVPRLAGLGIGVIIASPLLRTQRTAALIAAGLGGVPIRTDALFCERLLGDWNGLPVAQTEHLLQARQTPPGGESEDAFRDRVALALAGLRSHLDACPLVVSSKGVARMLNLLLEYGARPPAGNAEVIAFELAPEGVRR